MSRREIREHLFRILFRKEFHNTEDLNEQIHLYFDLIENSKEKEINYLEERIGKILEQIEAIDAMIEEVSSGWKLNRIGKVDLAIMRLAIYEIKFDEDIPTGVAINEAVEIAKIYGEDNSPSFINGILAKIVI